MKILFFTNVFPNPYEPTKGTFNLELVRALGRQHQIRVECPVSWVTRACSKPGSVESLTLLPAPGVTVDYVPYYYTPKILRGCYGWFLWHSLRGRIHRVLAEFKPDVVVGYWLQPDGDVAARIARAAKVPVALLVGGSDVLLLTKNTARRNRAMAVLRRADLVIAVSEHLREAIAALGVPQRDIAVVRRGVDEGRFSPGDQASARQRLGLPIDRPTALWVGRMVPVKGLEVLLDASARLLAGGVEHTVALVGEGPLEGALRARCAKNGLNRSVRFAGRVLHQDLPDWYRAADVTVLPSYSEGIPNTLLESIAAGVPFVASRVGGIPEIADESVDRLVPAGSVDHLAAALRECLLRSDLRKFRQRPPQTWPAAAECFGELLQRLVASPPNRAMTGKPVVLEHSGAA